MTTHSKKALFSACSYYKPADLTPELVHDYAPYLTQEKLAQLFKISRETLMGHFGDSYYAGKAAHQAKRCFELETILDQLAPSDECTEIWPEGYSHRHPRAKTNEYLRAWALRYGDKLEDAPVSTSPLAALTELQLREALEKLGYVKKDG